MPWKTHACLQASHLKTRNMYPVPVGAVKPSDVAAYVTSFQLPISAVFLTAVYGKEALSHFFELLTEEQRASIRCVSADGAWWIASCVPFGFLGNRHAGRFVGKHGLRLKLIAGQKVCSGTSPDVPPKVRLCRRKSRQRR